MNKKTEATMTNLDFMVINNLNKTEVVQAQLYLKEIAGINNIEPKTNSALTKQDRVWFKYSLNFFSKEVLYA